MELNKPIETEIKFINDANFQEEQIEGAKKFLTSIFSNESNLYKQGVKEGTIVLKGGREGTLVSNKEAGVTYRIIGQCIGNVVYVEDIF